MLITAYSSSLYRLDRRQVVMLEHSGNRMHVPT
jgi:hypothetical protein